MATSSTARYLGDLSHAMGRALLRCHLLAVRVGHEKGDAGIQTPTLKALVRHHLIEQGTDSRLRTVWKPTDRGMTVIRTEEPRFLAAASDALYTNDPAEALPDEGQALDEVTQEWYSEDGRERFLGQPGRRKQALEREAQNLSRRLRQGVRSLDSDDLEVGRRLQRIQKEIEALEAMRSAA